MGLVRENRTNNGILGGIILGIFVVAGSPFLLASAAVGAILLLLEDFYAWTDGKKSSQTLAPVWQGMVNLGKEINETFKEVGTTFKELFEIMGGNDMLGKSAKDLWSIKEVLHTLFTAPIAGIHALLMGIKTIVFGTKALWALAHGDVQGAWGILDQLDKSLERSNNALYDLDVLNQNKRESNRALPVTYKNDTSHMQGNTSLDSFILAAAGRQEVSPAIIKAMIKTESGFDPNAIGPLTKYGRAMGAMQLLPSTAAGLGLPLNDILNPELNIEKGTKYFRQMLNKYGNTKDALMAYNWGPRNMDEYGPENAPLSVRSYANTIMQNARGKYREIGSGGGETSSSAGSRTVVFTGGIDIQVSGAGDPKAVSEEVMSKFIQETQRTQDKYFTVMNLGLVE